MNDTLHDTRDEGNSASHHGDHADLDAFIQKRLGEDPRDLYAETLAVMERCLVTSVLQHTNGNQSHASRILGITRGSLRNKIRRHGISVDPIVTVRNNEARQDNPMMSGSPSA